MNQRQKGFTLIELLIVVAIILIIAAIAIPNLLRSKMAANEAAAVGGIRTVVTSQVTYYSTYGTGYAVSFTALSGPATASATWGQAVLLDPTFNFAAPAKQGYNYVMAGANPPATVPASASNGKDDQTFDVTAYPITIGTTGQRSFCDDQSGAILYDPTGAIKAATGTSCSTEGFTVAMGQ